jgi:hypothetical protein
MLLWLSSGLLGSEPRLVLVGEVPVKVEASFES